MIFLGGEHKGCCLLGCNALHLEDGGSRLLQNTGICLLPTTLHHFSDDCNLYKSVSEVFKGYEVILP